MLGKTHLKMGNKDEAKKWCTKALELKILHPDDEKVPSAVIVVAIRNV